MLLTKNELIFIDDKITLYNVFTEEELNGIIGEETIRPLTGSAMIGVSEDFIYKISKGLLECIDNKINEIEIDFNLYEATLIKEIAISSAKIGDEPVGINLKIKAMREIVKTISSYRQEEDSDEWEDKKTEEIDIDSFKITKKQEKTKEEISDLLNKWKQENDNPN